MVAIITVKIAGITSIVFSKIERNIPFDCFIGLLVLLLLLFTIVFMFLKKIIIIKIKNILPIYNINGLISVKYKVITKNAPGNIMK